MKLPTRKNPLALAITAAISIASLSGCTNTTKENKVVSAEADYQTTSEVILQTPEPEVLAIQKIKQDGWEWVRLGPLTGAEMGDSFKSCWL